MIRIYILVVLFISLLTSCYYDKEEQLYPEISNSCDTSAVKFSTSVSPMLSNYCLNCHNTTNANTLGGGYDLHDYTGVKTNIEKIWGSIILASGFSPMPKNSSKLDNCSIAKFRIWRAAGSPNN